MDYQHFHEIDKNPETNKKLANIINNIEANGWQGLPLLALGNQLLTGCHRATACEILDIEPEVYEIDEQPTDDNYHQYLWETLGDAMRTDEIRRAIKSLAEEGLVEQEALDIIDAEDYKE